MERLIFHIDVNSAFLSWESARRVAEGKSDLRLVPAVVGGDPKKRTGIVLAKSVPAKKYNIQTGEPMGMALKKCPTLISVPPDFRLYSKCSKQFKKICAEYAPVMESFSIDEVFLDMTGTSYIYPDPIKTAHEIKDRIKSELGFTVNIGISVNKLLAKMASDFEKPDKVHTLFPDEIEKKMWPLDVKELLFLGKATAKVLHAKGIHTIGQLAECTPEEIDMIIGGKSGRQLLNYARGIDDSPVKEERDEAKSYSIETTVEESIASVEAVLPILLEEVDVVSARMRRDNKKCSCISVIYRTDDFKRKSRQCKVDPTDISETIYKKVVELFKTNWKGESLRLIGVALSDLTDEEYTQFSLFGDDEHDQKRQKMDKTVDALKEKFGYGAIRRASTMNTSDRIGRKAKNNDAE